MRKTIAIFASGSGSNAENIIKYFAQKPDFQFIIISNKKNAGVLERAKNLKVKSFVFDKSDFDSGEKILKCLHDNSVNFIVLAGFLLKIPKLLINNFPKKIMNIHPALLPKYGGLGMYGDNVHQAVKAAAERESGITIHFVNENYDEGDIIFQAKCHISPADTADDIASKVHSLEYQYFPKVIEKVFEL